MKYYIYLSSLISLLFICSCGGDDDKSLKTQVMEDFVDMVYDNYMDAYVDANTLSIALSDFTSNPSQSTFNGAKTAWLQARESYGITESFRFSDGPIDVINGEEGPEGLLNSWPMDEAYVDYVDGAASAGIINDLSGFPTINKSTLANLNGVGGEEKVSVGYHAIEFLLWGQDNTAPSAMQAGMRPYTDFVDGGTAANQDRRRAYIVACGELLLDNLQLLLDQWKVGGEYRNTFLSANEDDNLGKMMTGMAFLAKSELAGERMLVAVQNQDQEDEHSCFSDNTHRDIRLNFDGIKNVYYCSYNNANQNSISDLLRSTNASLSAELDAAMTAAETAVYATGIPFDNAIINEQAGMNNAINLLRSLGDKIAEAGTALGVQVDAE